MKYELNENQLKNFISLSWSSWIQRSERNPISKWVALCI